MNVTSVNSAAAWPVNGGQQAAQAQQATAPVQQSSSASAVKGGSLTPAASGDTALAAQIEGGAEGSSPENESGGDKGSSGNPLQDNQLAVALAIHAKQQGEKLMQAQNTDSLEDKFLLLKEE